MVDRSHPRLSVGEQCRLLSLPRSTFYYSPQGETPLNLTLMRRIDEQFLETPFYGVRQMTWHLRAEGTPVNEKRIRRLMRLMGLMPNLLRSLRIDRANHVWCADVTYIPMQRGFLYLIVIMDWATRKVLTWRLSNTLDAEPCVDALTEAIARLGAPEIMNTDQGSQFTSWAWTNALRQAGVRISMDGKGRFLDNIFVERLWRSLKYECVYLHAWSGGSEARRGIGAWIDFYNQRRPHTALAGRTPDAVYWQHRNLEQPDQQDRSVA